MKFQINRKNFSKKKGKALLQKQNTRCIQFRDLDISDIELENRLKTMEKTFLIIDSENS